MTAFWTEADQAELDVLLFALTSDYDIHRRACRACRPEPCAKLQEWLEHKTGCRACEGDARLKIGGEQGV